MSTTTSTQIRLASRPEGWPSPDNFDTAVVELGPLEPGQVRVANEFISVDPYMRGRMNDTESYVAPYGIGETIAGGAVGRVTDSAAPGLPVGTPVLHQHGWTDVIQDDATTFRAIPEIPGMPLSAHLHILGMTGLTAYVGLTTIAELKPGETVFVSGAAGAVGSAVGQIARLLGAGRVIGSAGTQEKVDLLLTKYGFDAAFNYRDGDVNGQLAAAAPQGIDVYFDNVGGDHLEAALNAFNAGGRAALCGAISTYNAGDAPAGPNNLSAIITKGLMLKGFTVGSYLSVAPEFQQKMGQWLSQGAITYDETIVDGLDNTVEAFIKMMQGANTGKMLVRI